MEGTLKAVTKARRRPSRTPARTTARNRQRTLMWRARFMRSTIGGMWPLLTADRLGPDERPGSHPNLRLGGRRAAAQRHPEALPVAQVGDDGGVGAAAVA